MGLLSNPKSRQKIIGAVTKYNNVLSAACYIVGVIWFLALAYPPLNAKTYFSENALLPGVVESGFFFEDSSEAYIAEIKEELKKDKRNVPRDWLFEKFREIGLDAYIQNYTVKYPLQIVRGQLVPGQNVYAILRARRAASTEAVVLSVPFRSKTSDLPQTYGGIIVMLGLAKYFMRQPYWSKDIIFLVTDHEQIGMQAWLDGYHEVQSDYIQPGELPGRSGQIQAAINLEVPDANIKYFNVKIEGLNGQLPNLDLVNLVVRLCHKNNVDVMLHNSRDVPQWEAETVAGFQQSAKTMLKMMWAQASGLPSGNHGLFHRFHIEAVTLEGIRRKKTGKISLAVTGRVVEGIFRSLNNLLERFHQSFFFYILPGTERYVSIGLYMIPFGIICASCLVKAIALWVGLCQRETAKTEKNTEEKAGETEPKADDGQKNEEKGEKLDKASLNKIVDEETELDFEDKPEGVITILPLMLSSVIMALLCYTGPELLSNMAVPFKMNIEDGIFFGFLALFTASLLFPRMVARRTADDKRLLFDWALLKAVTLIFQSLVLFSLALLNISLAFFLAVLFVPVSVIVHPSKKWYSRWGQKLMLLAVSPLTILYAAAIISSLNSEYRNVLELLYISWNNLSQGLLLSMVDKYFFGSWLFTLFSFAVLPNWLTFWGISFCEAV
ncbi:glycosylphosphatidylinositol anchor attachment 1 protein-like [Ruditapes philippinarum]|uniref:glycosylphosphatidylinositol anchor attachment 1 protein-like n=1 Tax=Ruditapes philippinarum TaxID=129788 RepID=UPI00295B215C|nr:glycosylphosphatidylinositol anchor attachment 1 protein-like [Ruditapes philippinarum]